MFSKTDSVFVPPKDSKKTELKDDPKATTAFGANHFAPVTSFNNLTTKTLDEQTNLLGKMDPSKKEDKSKEVKEESKASEKKQNK